jgi:hypothetical protein
VLDVPLPCVRMVRIVQAYRHLEQSGRVEREGA